MMGTTNNRCETVSCAAILWAPHEERTTQLARRLNAKLFKIHYLLYKRPFVAPVKYIPQTIKTWWVLWRHRPDVVLVMNPPVFGVLSVYLYCRFSGARFVMDTHSPALYSRKWRWTVALQRFLARRALVNLVDQARYKQLFESWNAPALVLTNLPKCIEAGRLRAETEATTEVATSKGAGQTPFSVTVINTFAPDEPLEPVLEAARELPDVHFYILGEIGMARSARLAKASTNVTFTGYLLGDDYWNRLYSSGAVMALTTYPYSLLGGAQEGMALGKPLILSRQPALTDYFTKGVVFVDNTATSIRNGVLEARATASALSEEMVRLVAEKQDEWEVAFQALQSRMAMPREG